MAAENSGTWQWVGGEAGDYVFVPAPEAAPSAAPAPAPVADTSAGGGALSQVAALTAAPSVDIYGMTAADRAAAEAATFTPAFAAQPLASLAYSSPSANTGASSAANNLAASSALVGPSPSDSIAKSAAANTTTLTSPQPDYGKLVESAYGGIGRTGFGAGTSQIDQPGYNWWLDRLKSGEYTPETFRSAFNTAVQNYITEKPQDVYSTQALGTMVSNVLNPATNLTEAQRAAGVLGLQNKFGLTDADIARYSGNKLTSSQVTDYLAPIKTFQTDYQTIMSNPTSKASDIVNFVNSSLENKQISGLYGSKLTDLKNSEQFKEIERLASVGAVKDYEGNEYNPLTLLKLAGQIGKNLDTSKISGSVFGTKGESVGFDYSEAAKVFGKDPNASQQVLLDMARSLIKSGVTDIGQLYGKDYVVPATEQELDSGTRTIPEYTTRGVFAGDKRIEDEFGRTYTGPGGTGYRVTIDPATGAPRFSTAGFTTGESEFVAPLMMLAGLTVAPWLAGQISGLLPGAAITGTAAAEAGALGAIPATSANLAASNAIASGLLSGVSAELQGGDFGTGFVRGGLPSVVGYGLNQIIPTEFTAANPQLSNALRSVGTNVITAGLTGQDVNAALIGGVQNSTVGAALNLVPGYSDLPAAGKVLVNQAVNSAVRGGRMDPMSVALSVISAQAAADRAKNRPMAKGGLAMASGGAVPKYEDGGFVDFEDFSNYGDYSYDPRSFDFGGFDFGGLNFDAGNFDIGSLNLPDVSQYAPPAGVQLASLESDSGSLPRFDVPGVPTFAESPNAPNVPLNWNERLLSAAEFNSDTNPPGTYYDPARNAWITSSDALLRLEDIESQGFGYGATIGGLGTGDFSRADRDLYGTQLDQNVIDTLMSVPSREDGAYTGTNVLSDEAFTQQLIDDMAGDLGRVEVRGPRESLVEDDLQSYIDYGPGREDIVSDAGVSTDLSTPLVTPTDLDTIIGGDGNDVVLPPVTIRETRDPEGCAEGYHEENGICVADTDVKPPPVDCPEGYVYNFNTKSCEKVESPISCPPGYVYNPATKQCQKITTTPPPPPKTTTPAAAPIPGPAAINIPPVQQLAPLALQSLRTEGAGKFQDPLERLKEAVAATRPSAAEMYKMDPYLESILRQRMEPGYYNYGRQPSLDDIMGRREMASGGAVPGYAQGGATSACGCMPSPLMAAMGGQTHAQGREDFRQGKHVSGPGDGQSDDIPAMLADGEFVFPADVVAALGNGSTKAGTDKLYEMMHNIRKYHRNAQPKDLPPAAKKSPLDYLSKKTQGAKA